MAARPIVRGAVVCLLALCASLWCASELRAQTAADIRTFTLRDQNDAPTSLYAFEGRTIVLHFMFTHCVSSCHLQIKELKTVRQALAEDVRSRVEFISITLDPEHDTPETLHRYAQNMGIDDAGWRLATASTDVIDQLIKRFGITRKVLPDGQLDHTLAVFLFDARGSLMQRYTGPVDTTRLTREISEVVAITK